MMVIGRFVFGNVKATTSHTPGRPLASSPITSAYSHL